MMQALGEWVLSVTCAALLGALVCELTGKGALGQVGRLASGLVLLWAVLSPLPGVELSRLFRPVEDIAHQIGQEQERLKGQSGDVMCAVIERESEAYILDKAQQLGLNCQVQVACRQEEGVWLPWSVRIVGIPPSDALSRLVEEHLGVDGERIRYEGGE